MTRLSIVFPGVGEPFNGIGDHTRLLAAELHARGADVRLIGRGSPPAGLGPAAYTDAWPSGRLRDVDGLVQSLLARSDDLVLIQFEQFAYGYRGYNPAFSRVLRVLRDRAPRVRRMLYVHETYPAATTPSRAAMRWYQRRQLVRLVHDADTVLHASERGLRQLSGVHDRQLLLPVYSNIPVEETDPESTRAALGIARGELAVVVFGHLDAFRTRAVHDAFAAIVRRRPARLLYLGKQPEEARALASEDLLVVIPHADGARASRVLSAADLALSPFADGVSGRRGSFASFIRHGLPTVTNIGQHTDTHLRTAAACGGFASSGAAVADFVEASAELADDAVRRERMRAATARIFGYIPSVGATADAVEVLARTARDGVA